MEIRRGSPRDDRCESRPAKGMGRNHPYCRIQTHGGVSPPLPRWLAWTSRSASLAELTSHDLPQKSLSGYVDMKSRFVQPQQCGHSHSASRSPWDRGRLARIGPRNWRWRCRKVRAGRPRSQGRSRVGKSEKRRETSDAIARRTPGVDRRRRIGVTQRHAAEQHVLGREGETGRYGLVPVRPRLDAAGVQALAAGKQHDGLHEHAEVRPLRRPHGAVDGKEQPDRRAKQLEIARILAITRSAVLARNPDRMIELCADLTAPGVIWLLEGIRVDLVLGALPS